MNSMLEEKFRQWVQGKNPLQARVSMYEKIRDIPYAVIPRLNHAERYVEILKLGKGSCTPKHFLLCDMFQRLGLLVLYAVYPFRWGEWDPAEIDYPSSLWKLAQEQPVGHHIACRVEIGGRLVLVDATLDSGLKRSGLPVNSWDGITDTTLPVNPCGEEQLYHPLEARLMQPRDYDEKALQFHGELNRCFEEARRL